MDPSAAMKFLELSRFWVQRVLVPILVLIGAGGNIVTVMVLTRRRMRCSTNIYLTALAVADLIYLFFVLILSFEHYPNINDIKYELYWRFYGVNHWFADAASSTSIWLTVSFTVERYIAVCHPIRGKVLCTEKRAKRVITAVSIICILATASTTFEYQLTTKKQCIQKECSVIESVNKMDINSTEYNTNPTDSTLSTINTESLLETTENSISNNNSNLIDPYSDWEEIVFETNSTSENENGVEDRKKDLQEEKSPFNMFLKEILEESTNIIENETATTENIKTNCILDTGQTNYTDINRTNCINLQEINDTDCCKHKVLIHTEPTQLGANKTYRTVFYWFSSVSFAFLPLIIIATINCFLVNAVRKSQKERKRMTKSQENSTQTQENRMTVILISVVMLFLICQTPTACLLIYTSVYPINDIIRGLGNVFNLLVSINAACNFLLYCALSDKYRRTFKALFCERRMNRQDTISIATNKIAQRFNNQRNGAGCKRNASAYLPRTYETQSLTSIPRAKSMIARPLNKKGDNMKV